MIGDKDGNVKAEIPNPAVDVDLLREVLSWKRGGASFDPIVEWLRICTVPSGYVPHNWIEG